MQLIDTHCHLDFPNFDPDRDAVVERALSSGVSAIINVASSLEASKKSILLSKQYDCVFATVGMHPHEAAKVEEEDWQVLEKLLLAPKVVAIGEVGLDYYRNLSPKVKQQQVFERFISLAAKFNLPLVVHSRDSQADSLSILRRMKYPKVVIHCFSGDEEFLKECLDLGFYVSFTANLTYKKVDDLRHLVSELPQDKFFLETDAPFLAPQAMRGKRNEPAYLKYLLEELSLILHLHQEEIAIKTSQNAKKFFSLDAV
ncbi:MAG: TatD family hydrolase [Candidatus Omnitrophota bacterium]